jgi:hypothetical protein
VGVLLDILQSVPILSFLPVVVLSPVSILPQGFAVKLSTKDTKKHQAFLVSSCAFAPFVEKKEIPINSSWRPLF